MKLSINIVQLNQICKLLCFCDVIDSPLGIQPGLVLADVILCSLISSDDLIDASSMSESEGLQVMERLDMEHIE